MNKEMITSSIKNQAIAPGLSLVCWVNENPSLVNTITNYRVSLDTNYKNKIIWYDIPHLHITLYSLIRTIYNRISPLGKLDVQLNIEEFVSDLSRIQSFEICLNKISIEKNGEIQITGTTRTQADLVNYNLIHETVRKHDPDYKYFTVGDEEKHENLHCNFGYFVTDDSDEIKEKMILLESEIIYSVNIISIVHYMRRTLENKYMNGYLHLNTSTDKTDKIMADKIYQMLGLV